MNFLVLVIAVLIEHFFDIGRYREKVNLATPYFDAIDGWFGKKSFFSDWLGLACAVIPALALLWILCAVFNDIFAGILYPLFSLFVLLYCLGGFDFQASTLPEVLAFHASKKFTVIFWFVILGPFGAVFSRLLSDLADTKRWEHLSGLASFISEWLSWLPVRLLCLSFALVGSFSAVVKLWFDQVLTGAHNNMNLLIQSVHNACEESDLDPIKLSSAAIRLFSRALLIWLAVLALIVIF